MLSTTSHSTSRSANNLSVQPARPSGGSAQAKAIRPCPYWIRGGLLLDPPTASASGSVAPCAPRPAPHPLPPSGGAPVPQWQCPPYKNRAIASSFMAPSAWFASQQQDPGLSLLESCRPPLGNRRPQFLLLLLPQLHPVFLHLHHPLTSQSSFVTTRYDTPAITSKLVVYQAVLTFETSGDFANPSSSFPLSRESSGRSR